jgi:hypothetical protein
MEMETPGEEEKAPDLQKQCQLDSAGRDFWGVVIRDRAAGNFGGIKLYAELCALYCEMLSSDGELSSYSTSLNEK